VLFQPYYLTCLSHASYLVGDRGAGVGAVVDPQRDVEGYLEDAKRLGVAIRHVVLTHFHADFVSGHLELAKATGASIHVGARAKADYAFVPARDGDEIVLGSVRLRVLETPGHTPESICLAVLDGKDATRPVALLTGDTLFLGDVGRPDLMASVGVSAEELAGQLYDSIHRKILPLPDETVLWPAHGAGSLCGKSLSADSCSPLGVQRRTNYALGPMSKAEFVRLVTADQPETPSYFGYDADLNRRARPTLAESLERSSKALSLDAVLALRRGGATVLDARSADDFAAEHLEGSVSVPLSGRYALWAGAMLDRRKPIVVVAPPGREREAAMRLGRIGFDGVAGHLAGGPAAWRGRDDLVRRGRRTTAPELETLLASPSPPAVVDVRAKGEWDAGHLEGALHVPLLHLLDRLGEIPRDRDVVIHCQTGHRSSVAASLLQRAGFSRVTDLAGGWVAWCARNEPAFPPP
jgi:glyoxylase-like metal-dependent hydrolase (beta-lactamase superfamily II)/rhodanese-related sulfurtransferase